VAQGAWRAALVLGAQAAWWFFAPLPSRTPHVVVLVLWAVATPVYLVVMPRWRYRVHRWEATQMAVYTQTGWLTQERRIAPMNRIQTVDLHRGLLARLLGVATVTVTTASAAGPLTVEGLDLDVAERLATAVTASAEAEEDDAT
jgi:membrane protein YdbS with pleckstrin-like domain